MHFRKINVQNVASGESCSVLAVVILCESAWSPSLLRLWFLSAMDVLEFSMWLKDKGISPRICDIFEGTRQARAGHWSLARETTTLYQLFLVIYTENEIDRESFLDMNEADFKAMVKPLGVVKKLVRLRAEVSIFRSTQL